MKYAVIQCSNGNFSVVSEWSDLEKAKVNYHNVCMNLWNSKDVVTGAVLIVDENLFGVEKYRELISHPVETEPTEE